MTDYNDGKWHGWNGGECPVHPDSDIEIIFSNAFGELMRDTRKALGHFWHTPDGMLKAETFVFRVIKEYRAPREWWAVGETLHKSREKAETFITELDSDNPGLAGRFGPVIHVREVIE